MHIDSDHLPHSLGKETIDKNMIHRFRSRVAKATFKGSMKSSSDQIIASQDLIMHKKPSEEVYLGETISGPN